MQAHLQEECICRREGLEGYFPCAAHPEPTTGSLTSVMTHGAWLWWQVPSLLREEKVKSLKIQVVVR